MKYTFKYIYKNINKKLQNSNINIIIYKSN